MNKGETVIKCASGDRYILPFPGSTPMIREGDDLVLLYEKDHRLRLSGFYRVVRKVKLILDGQEIDPIDFFAQMDAPALMPAEGEGHEESQAALTAHGHIWDVMRTLDGLDHLKGLDIGLSLAHEGRDWEAGAILINDSRAYAFSSLTSQTGTGGGNQGGNPAENPASPVDPAGPDIPAKPGDSSDPAKPASPDDPNEPDDPSDPAKPDPGQAPEPEKPDPVHPDPPAPGGPDPPPFVKPWPEGMEPPVRIGIVDERDCAKHQKFMEKVMADEEKIPYMDGGISTQADETGGETSRPTYETTNPNLPTRFGVSFEIAEGYRVIEVVEQGLHGHVESEGEGDDQAWFYYLDEAIKHETAQDRNLAIQGDTVVLLVGDAYGNEWEVEVPVNIRDDVPEFSLGGKDIFEVTAGHEEHAAGIIFNFGADDAEGKKLEVFVNGGEEAATTVTDTGEVITVKGEYGTLTINPDGSYSYKADAYTPGAEGGTDSFSFKITDADGDSVDVDINGKTKIEYTVEMPDAPELSAKIDEHEAIIDGKPAAIEVPEGYHIISGGTGEHGSISQIDGSWVYTLDEELNHGGEDDGKNVLNPGDTVQIRVGDEYGNVFEVDVPVAVVDDIPGITLAEDLTVEAGETASSTGKIIFDFGADKGEGKSLTVKVDGKEDVDFTDLSDPIEIQGNHGKLTINGDGSYSYAADGLAYDAEPPTDSFTFVIKDADGDIVSADAEGNPYKLTITHERPEAPELTAEIGEHEAIIDHETAAIAVPEGYHIISGGTGEHGSISQVDGSWVYTLDEALDHGGEDDGKNRLEPGDAVKVIVGDAKGNTWEVSVPIAVIDDVPVAEEQTGKLDEGATDPVSGTVIGELTGGADGVEKVQWGKDDSTADVTDGTEIKGLYGTLTANPDGTWSYQLDNSTDAVMQLKEGETLEDVFDFRVYDKDGDSSAEKLTITINGVDNGVTVTPGNPDPELPGDPDVPVDPDDPTTQGATELVFDKDLLGEDASALTKSGSMAIEAPDGVKSLAFGELEIPLDGTEKTIDTDEGTLTLSYTADGEQQGVINYKFEFKTPGDHPVDDPVKDTLLTSDFRVLVTDTDGSEAKSTLHIDIEDDLPTLALGEDLAVLTGREVMATGKMEFSWGADNGDGKKLTIAIEGQDTPVEITDLTEPLVITGTLGTLTIQPDGSYAYKANPAKANENGGVEKFTFSIMDADGDVVDADDEGEPYVLTVTVTKPEPPEVVLPEVDERLDNLSSLQVHEGSLADGVEIVLPEGYTIQKVTSQPKLGTIEEVDGKWVYKLNAPQDSGDAQGENVMAGADTFRLAVVREADGKVTRIKMSVDIIDDTPEVNPVGSFLEPGETVTGSIGLEYGADNGEGKSLSIIFDGTETVIDGETEIAGAHGTLTMRDDGTYSYTASDTGMRSAPVDTFTVRVKDADGDVVEKPLEFVIGTPVLPGVAIDPEDPDTPLAPPAGYRITGLDEPPLVGAVEQDRSGNWIFKLGEGEELGDQTEISFTLRLESDGGAVIVQRFTVPVSSGAEEPAGPGAKPDDLAISVSEGEQLIEGKMALLDIPDGCEVIDIQGAQYGTVLQEDGKWIYKLDAPIADESTGTTLTTLDLKDALTLTVSNGIETKDISLDVAIANDIVNTDAVGVSYQIRYSGGYLGFDLYGTPINLEGYHIDSVIQQGQCHKVRFMTNEDCDANGEAWFTLPDEGVWLYNAWAEMGMEALLPEIHYASDPSTLYHDADGNVYDSMIIRYISDETGEARDVTLWINLGDAESVQSDYEYFQEMYRSWAESVEADDPDDPDSWQPDDGTGTETGFGHGGDDLIIDHGGQDNLMSVPMTMSLMDSMLEDDEGSLTSLLDPLADWQDCHGYGLSGQTITGQLSAALHDGETLYVQTSEGAYEAITEETPISLENGTLTLNPDGSWAFEASTAGTETLKLKVADADGHECQFDLTLESLDPGSAGGGEGVDIPVDAGVGMVADAYDDLAALAAQQQAENV